MFIYYCILFISEPEQAPEQHMFKDFDWISPELLSSHLESSSDKSRQVPSQQQPNNSDNGASNLTEEIQDLRIRGYGD